jgi:hypothetical protein
VKSKPNVTPNPTPAAASGIANIPAPIVVPATIKILPRVRFFTLFAIHTANNNKLCRAEYGKLRLSSNEGYKWCNEMFT